MASLENTGSEDGESKKSAEIPNQQRRNLIKKIAAAAVAAEVVVLADGTNNVVLAE